MEWLVVLLIVLILFGIGFILRQRRPNPSSGRSQMPVAPPASVTRNKKKDSSNTVVLNDSGIVDNEANDKRLSTGLHDNVEAIPPPQSFGGIPGGAGDDSEGDDPPALKFETEEVIGVEPPAEPESKEAKEPLPPPAPQPAPVSPTQPADSSSTLTGGADYKPLDEILQDAEQVHFSAYYPREVMLNDWQPLIAYIYRAMATEKIIADVQRELGEQVQAMRRGEVTATHAVQEGALITATPHLDGFQFNPPSLQIGFYEEWHRLAFKLRAKDAPLQQAVNGGITFSVEGVIVGELPLSIFVTDTINKAATEPVHTTQKLYQSIFCSYSHDDTHIVERVERAYRALGLDYLRDVHALKSGQDWDDRLLELIENADIFQLFWSQTAATSPFVEKEWRHALIIAAQKGNFIRPVYWQEPIPPVPNELSHIHFAHQPDLS